MSEKEIIDVVNLARDFKLIKKNLRFYFKSSQPVEEIGFLPKYNEYGVGFKHAVVRNSLEVKMKDIIYNTDNFKIYIQKVKQ